MTPSAAATDAARRLWALVASGADEPDHAIAAAQGLRARLRAGLAPWIGADGYRALVDRALGLTRGEHPELGDLIGPGGDEPPEVRARVHRASSVQAGMEALVAVVIELLGGIVGEGLAVRLVEQAGVPKERGGASPDREGERDV
jgi:hypothetical protein